MNYLVHIGYCKCLKFTDSVTEKRTKNEILMKYIIHKNYMERNACIGMDMSSEQIVLFKLPRTLFTICVVVQSNAIHNLRCYSICVVIQSNTVHNLRCLS